MSRLLWIKCDREIFEVYEGGRQSIGTCGAGVVYSFPVEAALEVAQREGWQLDPDRCPRHHPRPGGHR